jgi:hypothetical protein
MSHVAVRKKRRKSAVGKIHPATHPRGYEVEGSGGGILRRSLYMLVGLEALNLDDMHRLCFLGYLFISDGRISRVAGDELLAVRS